LICGIDEAGRGPLAGPVCAASVILKDGFPLEILRDSKKLSAKKRREAEKIIREGALAFGTGRASHTEIDEINILRASLLAMERAFFDMMRNLAGTLPAGDIGEIQVIVDGLYVPENINVPAEAVVKADSKVHSVMAASILAKTARDREMEAMAKLYPEYGYEKHKGYPTKEHKALIAKYGPSPIQRLSFRY